MAHARRWGLIDKLGLDAQKLVDFLVRVDKEYFDIPYHNAIHAADVVHATHFFLASCGGHAHLQKGLKEGDVCTGNLHTFALILAAAVHDLQHDGYNNRYHELVKSTRAQRWEKSIQERHHLDVAFRLLGEDSLDFTAGWPAARRGRLVELVREQVLATDMNFHFDLIAEFQAAVGKGEGNKAFWNTPDSHGLLCRLVLHAADISNPARAMEAKITWASLVCQEFFNQGDEERDMGAEISPNCDIKAVNLPVSQEGFIRVIVRPTFELIGQVLPAVTDAFVPHLQAAEKFYGGMSSKDLPKELRFTKLEGGGKFLYRPQAAGLAKPRPARCE